MNRLTRCTCFIFLLVIPLITKAQDEYEYEKIETLIESVVDNLGEEIDATMILQDLQEFYENPVNINSAGSATLGRLHILDDIQIQKLLDYRDKYGPVYSIYELNTVEGISEELLKKLKPFIRFGQEGKDPVTVKKILNYGRHELMLRALGTVQKPAGYKKRDDGTTPFAGNRARYYARYSFKYNDNLSAGITAEKDPGEEFFCGSNRSGFDFYSGHISMKISSFISNITIGDFIARSGQGLVLWQGFATGKSLSVLNTSKVNHGSRPFTSTDENRFFRGIATTLNRGNGQLTIFYSRKGVDANLVFPDSSEVYFTSLQSSGYHRTVNEIADKKSVTDINTGVTGSLYAGNLRLGMTFLFRKFDIPYMPSDQLYTRYRFRGNTNHAGGIDYLYNRGKFRFFGEAAVSKSKGKAFLQGLISRLHDQLQFSLLFRHFDKNYHSMWASAFSESGSVANESGLYLGMSLLPLKYITLSAYTDFSKSDWINYTTTSPSTGFDFQIQSDFRLSEKIQLYLRYKNKKKDKKFSQADRYVNNPEKYSKSRLHFQYNPLKGLTLKTRVEHVLYKRNDNEKGWMVFQDLQLSPGKLPVTTSLRFAWFDTESYNTRIYAYENDLLYTFSIPAYFDKGFRTYLNLKCKINANLEFWIKLGHTHLKNADTISSGHNEIEGNKKSEVKFQLRLKI